MLGKKAKTDTKICPDLNLNYVKRLKVLGVTFASDPKDMEENYENKVIEIKKLLNRWSFRNLTVYGRVQLVKSLALSKITHIVQVIPNLRGACQQQCPHSSVEQGCMRQPKKIRV